MKHKASILQEKDGTCYLCAKLKGEYGWQATLHEHHIFDGAANRRISEEEGLKVYLCVNHHMIGPEAVHGSQANMKNVRLLQKDAQRAYEQTHSRAEFMALFGRNYLEDGDE